MRTVRGCAPGGAVTTESAAFSPFDEMPIHAAMQTADHDEATSATEIPTWIPPMPQPPGRDTDEGPDSAAPVVPHAEPLQNPGPGAFRWAVAAIAAVLALTEALSRLFVWISHSFRSGTAPAFLTGGALLLLTPALIFAAVRVFAVGRVGLTPFGMGLRRPASITDAAILGAAVWFCFLLFAASWVVLTTPKDELARQSEAVRRVDENPTRPGFDPPLPGASDPAAPVPGSAGPTATAPDDTSFDVPATDLVPNPAATPAKDDRHILLKMLGNHPPIRVLILILLATCIAAPIFEELFFRGFLFPAFAGRFGPLAAMIISGSLFGVAHAFVVPLRMTVPLGVMGIALAWLLQQTKSLVPGMAVHGFVNALGAGVSAGFGPHTATLIIGTWFMLILLLLPWLRRPSMLPSPVG